MPLEESHEDDGHAQYVSYISSARLICIHCGYSKEEKRSYSFAGVTGPCDWLLHRELYLQVPCCGKVLWAYNPEHLAFMEDYIRATIRESVPTNNKSLVSRLPTWMKSAKNREQVLQGLQKLRMLLA